jgi:hypothetical protein
MTTPNSLFSVHLENTRALDRAYKLVARQCRDSIARREASAIDSLTKTCIFLFGARMENRLYRLLYEPDGFGDAQRVRVMAATTVEEKWIAAINEAFCARRGLRLSQVPGQLGFTDKARYDELVRLVREQLAPMITLRNVLGHGQWHRALNGERTAVSSERMRLLATTRLWHLVIKANLLEHLVWLLHDLVVTKTAFEHDFDRRWKNLADASRRLELDGYARWEAALQASHDAWRKSIRGEARSSDVPARP